MRRMDRREFLICTVAGTSMAGSVRNAIAQGAPPPASPLGKNTPASVVAPAAAQPRVVAVKMLTPPVAPVAPVVEQLHKAGITAVFARIDDFFADATVERNVREFRKLLGDAGIQFYNTVPVFLDPAALAKDPSLVGYGSMGNPSKSTEADWLQFVCPTRPDYRKQRISWFASLVRELHPDGLSLDFIRYFIYWEAVAPDRTGDSIEKFCFCDYCLRLMTAELGFHFPADAGTRQAKAAWVLANHREEWTAWKCEKITSMVRESAAAAKAIEPELKISLHGVPWVENDYDHGLRVVVGQDLEKLASYVDIFGPMCYFEMLDRPPEWVHDVVVDYFRLTGKPPLPSVQASEFRRQPVAVETIRKHFQAGFESPSAGVNVFEWNSLRNDPEKIAILQETARGHSLAGAARRQTAVER
jgi:hypothetical protein